MLYNAGSKKKCSYMVLISDDQVNVNIPDNVIVINTLNYQLDNLLN